MLRALRFIGFAVLPTALLVAALEGVFTVAGTGGTHLDALRGFDPTVRYIVPDPEVPGGYRTQMYPAEMPHMEARVPPRGDALRVVLFGGSNTESFPEVELEQLLDRDFGTGGRDWEVINLGRQGYGSARVAILFEQALEIDPDLVVLYSGHNEFVELEFQIEVETSIAERSTAFESLARLRTFRVLEQTLGPKEEWGSGRAPSPDDLRWEHKAFKKLDFEQTGVRLAEYRANVERMLELAAARGVLVLLCTPIGNDLALPSGSGLPGVIGPKLATKYVAGRDELLASLPAPADTFVPESESRRILLFEWNPRDLPDQVGEPIPHLRPLGQPFDTDPPWRAAPERWMPRLRALLTEQDRFFHTEPEDAERAELEAWLARSQTCLDLVPDDPLVLFTRGLALHRLARPELAAETLHRAAARDRAPRAANDTTNGILHEIAAVHPEVRFVDTNELYRSRTPHGICGYELLRDECHLHPGAYRQLMADLAPEIARAME